MQHFLYLKTEHFNKKILGINLANLTRYQASVIINHKIAHAREEFLEIQRAKKNLDTKDISTFYEYLDGCIDLDYVLNGILFIDRRAKSEIHKSINYQTYKEEVAKIKRIIPANIPYMFAYNLVHRANMAKKRGNVTKRPIKYGFDAIKPLGWQPPDWATFFQKYVFPPRRKIAILGYSGAGKDTMAEVLHNWYGYEYTQATRFILENFLWEQYDLNSEYETYNEAYADRVNHRVRWYDMICDINKEDPVTVAKAIYANSDIYCGIRSMEELEAAYPIIDRVYWIHCAKRIPVERDSNDIHGGMLLKDEKWRKKLIVIKNHETLFKFKINIYKEMSKYEY